MKKCIKCKIEKELDSFYKGTGYDGKGSSCKSCISVLQKKKYACNIGKNINQIKYQNKNIYSGKIVNGKKLCSKCNELKTIENFSKVDTYEIKCGLISACKECELWRNRISSRILKLEFLIAYGGRCTCCGETNIEFLTVEHVRVLGLQLHYNQISVLLRKLKSLGWPKEGYTILCFNCNMSTKHGISCTHNKEYENYQKQFKNELIRFNKREEYFRLKKQLEALNR